MDGREQERRDGGTEERLRGCGCGCAAVLLSHRQRRPAPRLHQGRAGAHRRLVAHGGVGDVGGVVVLLRAPHLPAFPSPSSPPPHPPPTPPPPPPTFVPRKPPMARRPSWAVALGRTRRRPGCQARPAHIRRGQAWPVRYRAQPGRRPGRSDRPVSGPVRPGRRIRLARVSRAQCSDADVEKKSSVGPAAAGQPVAAAGTARSTGRRRPSAPARR